MYPTIYSLKRLLTAHMEAIPDIVYVVAFLLTEDRDVVLAGITLFLVYTMVQYLWIDDSNYRKPEPWWNASPPVYMT